MNKYSEFPKGTFPPVIEDFIKDSAKAQGLSADFLFATYISLISVLIGNQYVAKITGQWTESAMIWIALVGRSGIKKMPAIKLMFKPLYTIEKNNYTEYRHKLKEYDEAMKAGDTSLQKPRSKQMIVDDTTLEALYGVLLNNSSGVIMKKDELMTVVYEAGRYSKSNGNEERFLSIYNSEPITINRKGDDLHDMIEKPFVSLIGGVQPEVIKALFAGNRSENGFINRMLFVSPVELERKIPLYNADDKLADDYSKYIQYAYEQTKSNAKMDEAPTVIPLSTEALAAFKEWQSSFIYGNEIDKCFDGYLSKLEAYAVRFALIIEYSWAVLQDGVLIEVSKESIQKAIELCTYFFQCYQRVKVMQASPEKVKYEKHIALLDRVVKDFSKGLNRNKIILSLSQEGYKNIDISRATSVSKSLVSQITNGN